MGAPVSRDIGSNCHEGGLLMNHGVCMHAAAMAKLSDIA